MSRKNTFNIKEFREDRNERVKKNKEKRLRKIIKRAEELKYAAIFNNIALTFQNIKIFPSSSEKLLRIQGKEVDLWKDTYEYYRLIIGFDF